LLHPEHHVTLALDNPVVSQSQRARQARTFRWLLVLGAASSIAIGIWGVLWVDILERALGFDVDDSAAAFNGLARLFGGAMLTLGLGYALAAAQPHRSRSLLVVLFVAPLVTAVTVIVGAARDEIAGGQGAGFAAFYITYSLLFFRTYPRLEEAPKEAVPPADPSPPPVT
jgi:hypothetical protein